MQKEIEILAQELIDVKNLIEQLQGKEKAIKSELMPYIKLNGNIKLNGGMIYYSEAKGAKTFSRSKVLSYLAENFGQDLADQIDEECTSLGEPTQRVYVKLAKSVHD